jgi:hypothetical protein
MKRLSSLIPFLLVVLVTSCGNRSKSTDQAEVVPTEAAIAKPIAISFSEAFDSSKTDKQVIIEGYLQLPNMMYTTGDDAQVDFHARPQQRFGTEIIANVHTGDCNNCMAKLGEKYQLSDLKLKGDDGTEIHANERVRLTGRLRVRRSGLVENGLSVALDVAKIEKLPEIVLDYSQFEVVAITKENLFDTSLVYRLSSAEGKIEIPTMLFMENDVTLDLKVAGKRVGVNFSFGTGPNQIEPIPTNYAKGDFKIHDFEGNLVNLGKTVKVWGTRSTPGDESAGILYVERIQQ